MKIQLDTTKKTIKVEESVKLVKFMETVKKMLPDNEWKEFTLETNTTITYGASYPVYIEKWDRPWYDRPWISYCSKDSSGLNSMSSDIKTAEYQVQQNKLDNAYSLNAGVYNIETKD